jgi:hypothetical protein
MRQQREGPSKRKKSRGRSQGHEKRCRAGKGGGRQGRRKGKA